MPSKVKNSHLGGKTPMERMKEFPNEFYCDPDQKILFCATCEKSIDHLRRSTIVDHMKSIKHIEKKAWTDKVAQLKHNVELAAKIARQPDINTSFEIVLKKEDNPQMKAFLDKHVRNEDSISE